LLLSLQAASLQARLKESESRKSKSAELSLALEGAQSHLQTLESELSQSQRRVEELQKLVRGTEEAAEQLRLAREELGESKATADARQSKLQNQLLAARESAKEELQRDFDLVRSRLSVEIRSGLDRQAQLQAQVSHLGSSLEEVTMSRDALREQVDTLSSQLIEASELKERVAELETQAESSAGLKGRIAELENWAESSVQALREEQEGRGALEASLAEMQASWEAVSAERDEGAASLKGQSREVEQLRKALAGLEAAAEQSKQQVWVFVEPFLLSSDRNCVRITNRNLDNTESLRQVCSVLEV
jgi:chromosome segregation ATPase